MSIRIGVRQRPNKSVLRTALRTAAEGGRYPSWTLMRVRTQARSELRRVLVMTLALASACGRGSGEFVGPAEVDASSSKVTSGALVGPAGDAWDRKWQFANLPLAPRFANLGPVVDLTDSDLLPAFADPDAVASLDVDWILPRREPVRIDDKARIRRILGAFRARPAVSGELTPQTGCANARITVRYATGAEAVYVVAERSWEGGPDPAQSGSDSRRGVLALAWDDLRVELGGAR